MKRYKFQFNNDPDSCDSLKSLIEDGQTVIGFIIQDGYTWLCLEKD